MQKTLEITAGVSSIALFGYVVLGMKHWFPIVLQLTGVQ